MNHTSEETCRIWPGFPITRATEDDFSLNTAIHGSVRAGGDYIITHEATAMLKDGTDRLDDRVRARLTTMLIEMRSEGARWPMVTTKLIAEAENMPDMPAQERCDRLLLYLSEQTGSIANWVAMTWDPNQIQNRELMGAAATSQCDSGSSEVQYLVKQLSERGLWCLTIASVAGWSL